MKPAKRLLSGILALLMLVSLVPFGAFAVTLPDPTCRLGTFSGDMLLGGGRQVQTDRGLFYVGEETGFIYNLSRGNTPVLTEPAACLNYENGKLYFARIKDGTFDLCVYDDDTGASQVLLEGFSGDPRQVYLVDGEKLLFLADDTVWQLTLEDRALTFVRYAAGMFSFAPAGCGLVYAVGSIFNYTLYANEIPVAEHVESYYIDYAAEHPVLVYAVEGRDLQVSLAAAFAGITTATDFIGEGQIPAEELLDQTAHDSVRSLIDEANERTMALMQSQEQSALDVEALLAQSFKDLPEQPEEEPTEPDEAPSAETEPAEDAPAETDPIPDVVEDEPEQPDFDPQAGDPVTEPAETEPVATEPVETQPIETEPAETEPVIELPPETEPEPTEPAPIETQPAAPQTPEGPAAPAPSVHNSGSVTLTDRDLYPSQGVDYEIMQFPALVEKPQSETEPAEEPTQSDAPVFEDGVEYDPLPGESEPVRQVEQTTEAQTEFRKPMTTGILNIARRAAQLTDIRWTPRKAITGWGGTFTYQPGVTYEGIPYGQPVKAAYVPWKASLAEFIAYVNNEDSLMYTSQSTYYKVAPYYSTDCSGLVSWCWDLPYRQTTGSINNYATLVSASSYAYIQVGDCLNNVSSHVVLVTDVTYDSKGTVTGIEISEATPSVADNCCARRRWFKGDGLASFRSAYLNNGYKIYRSKTADAVTYTHECVIPLEGDDCPLCGQGMFFKPGIDVSEHNGKIDWAKVKPYIDFAIIRVGDFAKMGSDSSLWYKSENPNALNNAAALDDYYEYNVKECDRLGIPYGLYIYTRAVNETEAMEEADFVVSHLTIDGKTYLPELPVFFDVEEKTRILASNMSDEAILNTTSTFCQTLEDIGLRAGVYASTSPWNTRMTGEKYNKWCRWVAQYNEYCTAKAGAHLWQYSSNGSVPGISTRVDMNYWYGAAGSEQHRYQATKVNPTCTADGSLTYTCVECGQSIAKPIAATGHFFKDGKCVYCGAPQTTLDRFDDVKASDWFAPYVEYVVDNGLFSGTEEDAFEPDSPMSRAMMVTVLWRVAGKPDPGEAVNPFSDVADNSWFAIPVVWGSDQKVVNGVSQTRFDPNGNVTREQVATLLYRFAATQGMNTEAGADLSAFPDAGKVSGYAQDAMAWAVAQGLITGSNEGDAILLNPQGNATRAQVATIFMRYNEKLLALQPTTEPEG